MSTPAASAASTEYAAAHLARWAGGVWNVPPTFPVTSVTQDSRQVRLGSLYVALRGARFDGHAFVEKAFKAGATAALVSEQWAPPAAVANLPLLRVKDPARALLALARGYRQTLGARIIGVSGSAGKTTLKELTRAMLSGMGPAAATSGNLNNEVGLPLSLLAIPAQTRAAVIEAGISHPGDMEPLAACLCPDAAAITCIGPAHIAHFGSEQAIAAEKAKLLAAVPPEGFAVLPLQDGQFETLRAACRCRVVTCALMAEGASEQPDADYVGEPLAKGVVRLYHAEEPAVLLESGLCGAHNAANAVMAYALARESGATAAQALAGLATFKAPPMRWECMEVGEYHVINDAYNANPLSMRAALETFAGSDVPAGKVLCVGDMLELGAESAARHRAVGLSAGNGPWRLLVAIGPEARSLLEGALEAGYPASQTAWFPSAAEAAAELPLLVRAGDTLLLKASRGMALEQLIAALD